ELLVGRQSALGLALGVDRVAADGGARPAVLLPGLSGLLDLVPLVLLRIALLRVLDLQGVARPHRPVGVGLLLAVLADALVALGPGPPLDPVRAPRRLAAAAGAAVLLGPLLVEGAVVQVRPEGAVPGWLAGLIQGQLHLVVLAELGGAPDPGLVGVVDEV